MKNQNENPLHSIFNEGLEQMKTGLEKIKQAEKLYESDSWFTDFVTILNDRINVLETAASCEFDITISERR